MMPPDTTVSWHLLPVQANPRPTCGWIRCGSKRRWPCPTARLNCTFELATTPATGWTASLATARGRGARALGSFNVVPGMPTDTVLRFTHGAPGPHLVEVRLDDAPVSFDDVHHVGYNVSRA